MTDAQRALCVENIKLVPHCVKKFRDSGIEWDELCASGNLGLAQAAATFSPERNPNFATYAGVCIDNEVYKLLRKRKKHSRVVASLDDEIVGSEGLLMHDAIADGTDWAERAECNLLAAQAIQAINALPKRPRRMWELRLGLAGEPPMSQAEIADRLGCSHSLVSRVFTETRPKIQGALHG
jgi:RNA polymerase sporulation-specific sigma factor